MWIDPWGWVSETAPGYTVYGLFDKGSSKPYYIGITNDPNRRAGEHIESGRLDTRTGRMEPIHENVTYGQARGYEQANIEIYKTKTAEPGKPISQTNRGNKINSFDHNSRTRKMTRQKYFEKYYKSEIKRQGHCI